MLDNRLDQVIIELKLLLPDFETREEQYDMMQSTYNAMLNNLKVGIHAPTGTGKSLGYLLPYVAVKLDKPDYKITVSTFTIELQNQLKKDIILINKIYINILMKEGRDPVSLKYVPMIGKSNYLCLKTYSESKENNEIGTALSDLIDNRISDILKKDENLDKKNIGIRMNGNEWENMQVEKCIGSTCTFKDKCSYFKHYFSNQFDIYIVNHSLFFFRHFFVGEWKVDFNIFDESHKLEKVILESYTFDFSISKIEKWVRQGANIALKYGADQDEINLWIQHYLYKHDTVNRFKKGLKFIDGEILKNFMVNNDSEVNKDEAEKFGIKKSFDSFGFSSQGFKDLIEQMNEWQKEMRESITFNTFTSKIDDEDKFNEDKAAWTLNLLSLTEFNNSLKQENDNRLWVQKDHSTNQVSLRTTPLDINNIKTPFIKGLLFTSGTLAQNGTCNSFAKRLNVKLDEDLVLQTPFPLEKQTIVYISKNIAPPKSRSLDELKKYYDTLENEIFDLITKGNLKTFILFTAKSLMKEMHKRLDLKIKNYALRNKENVEIWIQEDNNHKDVLVSFQNTDKKSVLFGTLTYFEGIDLKGERLTQIILTKLPFSVPTDPIQEILNLNENYSEWEAVIRFEQAFGRLIRSFTDYGSFSILDNRIYKHPRFFDLIKLEKIKVTNDLSDVEQFYNEKNNTLLF